MDDAAALAMAVLAHVIEQRLQLAQLLLCHRCTLLRGINSASLTESLFYDPIHRNRGNSFDSSNGHL
jgi:hypothetical protein